MPPNQAPRPRGRPPGSTNKSKGGSSASNTPQGRTSKSSLPSAGRSGSSSTLRRPSRPDADTEMDVDPFADSQDPDQEPDESTSSRRRPHKEASRGDGEDDMDGDEEDDDDDPPKTIPPELLTRLLHEFFERDGTRVSRAANDAVARYMDIFVREAIARAAVEKEGGFLEVEDLEKIAPQLLLDL